MEWRTHSPVPRRHSCRRPATTECPYATRVSRRVGLDTARTECVRHLIEPSVRKAGYVQYCPVKWDIAFRGLSYLAEAQALDRRQKPIVCPTPRLTDDKNRSSVPPRRRLK